MNSLGCVSMGVVIKSAKPSSIFTNRWNKIQTCSARIRERNAVNPSNEVLYLFIYLYVFFVSSFWHSKQLNFMLRKWPQNDLYSLVPNWCSALCSPLLFFLSSFLSFFPLLFSLQLPEVNETTVEKNEITYLNSSTVCFLSVDKRV